MIMMILLVYMRRCVCASVYDYSQCADMIELLFTVHCALAYHLGLYIHSLTYYDSQSLLGGVHVVRVG